MKEALAESYLQDSESETVEEGTDLRDQADSDVVDVAADPLLTADPPAVTCRLACPCSCPCKEHSPRYESKNSQTVLPVNALDVCLLCAINRRRETSDAEVQVNLVRPVVLSEESRRVSSGEGDDVDTLSTDQEGDPGRSSTPVPISRSLFAGEGPSTDSSSVDNHGEETEPSDHSFDSGSEDESDTALSSSDGAAELVDDEECWGEGVEPAKEKKYIVFESQLSSLFSRCVKCGAGVLHKRREEIGSMVRVTTECAEGHTCTWNSQPTFRQRMPAGELLLLLSQKLFSS